MEILLNKMYTGSYTTTADDIGHEIINFFKTDIGENYVYILPYGGVGSTHNDQISHILFTGAQKEGKFEILAKVVGHEQIFRHGNRGNSDTHREQIRYIIANNIQYGGKYLHEILKNNTGNDEATYVSFKAQKIIRARKPIVIDQSKPEFSEINLQRSKGYVMEGIAYNKLVEMIEDPSLWEDDDTTKPVDVTKYTMRDNTNFLQLIRKEYDETIFTNLFHYYLSHSDVLRNLFVTEFLGVPGDEYSVEREKVASEKPKTEDGAEDSKRNMDRMDLWLEGKNNIVIIENKIKSGINGSRHDINGKLVRSQLSAYYDYASSKGKDVYCFIFAPNYNEIDTEKDLYLEKYKIVRYSEIYDFFKNPDFVDLFKDDPFGLYTQFVSALSMHIYRPDEEMERRFVTMINT